MTFPARSVPCSSATTSATTTGTASLTCCPAKPAGTAVGNDTRLFLNAIRYLAKTGIAWADPPTCHGKPNSLWQRYNRCCERGVRARIAAELRDDNTKWLCVDATCVHANVAAAGAKKADGSGGQEAEALSRSRGGFGSEIHGAVNPFGQSVVLKLTGSEAADNSVEYSVNGLVQQSSFDQSVSGDTR